MEAMQTPTKVAEDTTNETQDYPAKEKTTNETKDRPNNEDVEEVVAEESLLKRRSSTARSHSDNGSSTLTTVSSSTFSSPENASWATTVVSEFDTPIIDETVINDYEKQQQQESIVYFDKSSEATTEVAEWSESSVKKDVAATTEAAEWSQSAEWSESSVKKDVAATTEVAEWSQSAEWSESGAKKDVAVTTEAQEWSQSSVKKDVAATTEVGEWSEVAATTEVGEWSTTEVGEWSQVAATTEVGEWSQVAATTEGGEWSQSSVKKDDLAAKFKDVDIEVLMSAAANGKQIENLKEVKTSESEVVRKRENETVVTYEYEESDEEVVELEFDSAVETMHTHDGYSMYCPNCSSRITKVVLRRKIKRRRIAVAAAAAEPRELLGCLSCFSIFIPSGNRLNPFRIFGAGRERIPAEQRIQQVEELPTSDVTLPTSDVTLPTSDSTEAAGRGFDIFWLFRKRRDTESALTSPLLTEEGIQPSPTTVTPKPSDEAIEQEEGIQPSPTAVTPKPSDEAIEQEEGIQPSPTIVTPKPSDEAIEQAERDLKENIQLPQEQPTSESTVPTPVSPQPAGKGFDIFWFFKKRRVTEEDLTSPLIAAAASLQTSSTKVTSAGIQPFPTTVTSKPKDGDVEQGLDVTQKAKDTDSAAIGVPADSTPALADQRAITSIAVGKPSVEKPEIKRVPSIAEKPEIKRVPSIAEKPEIKRVPSIAAAEKVPEKPEIKRVPSIAAAEKVPEKPEIKGVPSIAAAEKVPEKPEIKRVPSIAEKPEIRRVPSIAEKPEIKRVPSIAAEEKVPEKPEIRRVPSIAAEEKVPEKPEIRRAPSIAAAEKVSQPSPPQVSVQDGNVIIDVYDKREEIIRGAKQPVQPVLAIQTDDQPQGDVRIPVSEAPLATGTPQLVEDVGVGATTVIVTEIVTGISTSLEIVKSIVYGGLMETIVSLVIVSLAAASDATTWNVVALGLASLVGGLVLLIHYLRVLRYGDSTQTNEQRYNVQLGRKELFPLHTTVAVLSYIIFGLIPPMIYGFTFRETNDRDFKMLAVAGASFLCIVILASAQAYARGENRFMAYFKTVLYYVFLAAIAAGAAFAIGYLAKDPSPCPTVLSYKEM